jgi:hypothetical protein
MKLNMETSEQPTLHDYFAAAALQGICANDRSELFAFDALAQMAFEAADEMLERRHKIRESRRHMQRMIQHANNTEAK